MFTYYINIIIYLIIIYLLTIILMIKTYYTLKQILFLYVHKQNFKIIIIYTYA